MGFRDVLDIQVEGGKGGDGGLSFKRLKYIPKGGPDGGHGGDGGSVYLQAVDDVTSLDRLVGRSRYRAGTGMQGEGRDRSGAGGNDMTIDVPVGTIAVDTATGEVIADMLEVGQRVIVAQGGSGGRGNASFANAQRRAPRFFEFGTKGTRRTLRLELRIIADVGLVGYPNAGKSSLLAAVSNARPMVADYPFTTLSPNLGVVEREHEHQRLTMADIPGIIEDAHLGKGLGLEFLRHISRTRLLVYVLDIATDPVDTLKALDVEVNAYDPALADRPSLIVLNKIDMASPDEVAATEQALARFGRPVVSASALERRNLDLVVETLFELLPPKQAPVAVPTTLKVAAQPVTVERDASGQGWVVRGDEIDAVVERFDASNREAVAYLQHFFRTLGVYRKLRRAGAVDGDNVIVAGSEFEYFDAEQPSQEHGADAGVASVDDLDETVGDQEFDDVSEEGSDSAASRELPGKGATGAHRDRELD